MGSRMVASRGKMTGWQRVTKQHSATGSRRLPVEERLNMQTEEKQNPPISQLASIGYQLRTQDNRITQNPMFCVQEKRRFVGLDSAYSENRCWHDSANQITVYDDDEDFKEPEGNEWDEFGYIDQWFTVMVAFTEAGCEEYLRLNGHNLKEPRIYVESFNRCPEMIAIRDALISNAVPELLEAAQKAVSQMAEAGFGYAETELRAAITKATGGAR
jgi:hypothetical protein